MSVALHVIEWVLFALAAYTFACSLPGFFSRRRAPTAPRQHRFAILVPAHDEEAVIAHAVRALRQQRYPREHFRIYVIADNCVDETATRAIEAGADRVLQRFDPARRGKGHALAWAADAVRGEWSPDAYCVFDADNVMVPEFLEAMNARLCAGARVIQGYLGTKNPDDSWITKASALGYAVSARLFHHARENLRFSVALGGTGYCIRADTLDAFPPDPSCLTDDNELQMRLLREGIRVEWSREALTYDEKPITMRASWRQRVRWMQGRWDVARRHTPALLWRALRRGDLAALDGAIACLQPSRSVVAACVLAVSSAELAAQLGVIELAGAPHVPLAAWAVLLSCYVAFPFAALVAEGVPPRGILQYAYTVAFSATWVPISILGMLRSGRREWTHTRHTRSIPLEGVSTTTPPADGGERVDVKGEAC